jgi:outer membrane protein OmpA-like peptidoglycan-associated protein
LYRFGVLKTLILKIAFIASQLLLISFFSFSQSNDDKVSLNTSFVKEEGGHYLTRVNSLSDLTNYSDVSRNQINFLIKDAISIYIDQSYRLSTTQIQFRASEKDMIDQMNNLVNQSLNLFQLDQYFDGFSYEIVKKLVDIKSLEWGINEYLLLGDDDAERDFVLANYIGHEIKQLENLCHDEINRFIADNNIEIPEKEFLQKIEDLAAVSDINSDPEDYISPMEFNLVLPSTVVSNKQSFQFPDSFIDGYNAYIKTSAKANKKRKRKKDYTQELITVIKQNSVQLSDLQVDLKHYNEAAITRDHEQNYALQMQISELQSQINDINKKVINSGKSSDNENINFRVTLDKTIIHFDKNSISIGASGKILLNKVFDSLLKMPKFKVIITGYTDKSGNTEQNVYLSQKRAEKVKKYLIKQGINEDRLIVNYMGDLYSNSENSSDRKVIVEFINKVSSIEFTSN